MTTEPEPKTWLPKQGQSFLHEITRDRVSAQLDSVDSLDSKIQTIVGFGATFVAIALATLAVRDQPVSDLSWIFLVLGVVDFVAIVLVGGWGYLVRDFSHGPTLPEAWSHAHEGYSEGQLFGWAADCYTQAYTDNDRLLKLKKLAVQLGMAVLLLEGISLGIAIANEL